MLIDFELGQTSIVLRVKIRNSSVATGAGLTGLTFSSTGLRIGTIVDNGATTTAYTAAGATIETVTTLGTYAAPTATKCRFRELDATSHPGIYELQFADARFAVAGAKSLLISISGATNAAECDVLIPLRAVDPYNGVNFGLTALPAVASGSAGAVITSGTGTAQLSVASGLVTLAGVTHTGAVIPTVTTTGTATNVTTVNGLAANVITAASIAAGAIDAATFAAGAIDATAIAADAITDAKVASDVTIASVTGAVGSVTGAVGSVTGNVGGSVASVTARVAANADQIAGSAAAATNLANQALALSSGSVNDAAATTTGFVGNSGLSAADDRYNGQILAFTSGTQAGIARRISDYTGATRTFAFAVAWPAAPGNTDAFVILGFQS